MHHLLLQRLLLNFLISILLLSVLYKLLYCIIAHLFLKLGVFENIIIQLTLIQLILVGQINYVIW